MPGALYVKYVPVIVDVCLLSGLAGVSKCIDRSFPMTFSLMMSLYYLARFDPCYGFQVYFNIETLLPGKTLYLRVYISQHLMKQLPSPL